MPKLPSDKVPTYRLQKSRGVGTVRLNGKDFYLGPYGTEKSKNEYDRLIADWLHNGRSLPDNECDDRRGTVTELVDKYTDYTKTYYVKDGDSTGEHENIVNAVRYLVRLYGRLSIIDFTPSKLKTIQEVMVRDGLSRCGVNARINRIRRVFKWGLVNDIVPSPILHGLQAIDPLKRGRTPAKETEPVKPVPEEYVNAVLAHVGRQVAAMIQLQQLTGMRSGEVVLMRAADIDMTGPLWIYFPHRYKTQHHDHPRVIELGPRAQQIIKEFLRSDINAYLFSPDDANRERWIKQRQQRQSKVQPSQVSRRKPNPMQQAGNRYTPNSYRQAIIRGCDKADEESKMEKELPADSERIIPRWHPHQLRHSYATMIRKKYGLEVAKVMLGHRSMSTTEIYAEIDRRRAAEIAMQVG